MPDRPPVYICAPYAAPTPEDRARNIARAAALARLAVAEGYAPICVHPTIPAIYGEEETPELREQGLEVDCALVRLVAGHSQGKIWCIRSDAMGRATTPGMDTEIAEWIEMTGRGVIIPSWGQWGDRFAAAGLLPLWYACSVTRRPWWLRLLDRWEACR